MQELNMKRITKKERIVSIAREVIERNGISSTTIIWENVNDKLRNGAYKAKVYSILKANPNFTMVESDPATWVLNQSIDADEALGGN